MSANMLMTQMAQPVTSVVAKSTAAPQYVTSAAPTYPTTTIAAPTTTMAAPVMKKAAPAVTTMAAPITMAAPTVTTMAAPISTQTVSVMPTTRAASSVRQPIVQAPVMQTIVQAPVAQPVTVMPRTQAASFVQQPIVQAPVMQTIVQAPVAQPVTTVTQAPSVVMAPPQVQAPVALTAGIPSPDQIAVQKSAYAAALEKQLKDGMETIRKENEIEKSMTQFTADKQVALMQMQVEEQRNEKLALLDEQATLRQCELRKAYVERKIQLDNQAEGFVMDYQMKAIQTELAQKQYAFQQAFVSKENALAAQYNQEVAKSQTGTTYAVPPQAVPAAAAKK